MTQMWRLFKLTKVLHLESTNVCQLECPLCARETNAFFNKKIHNHLTIDLIKKKFDEDFISKLEKMFICGVYGDPAAGEHTLEIYRYFRSINPNIVLGMNTNGALRRTEWWEELASILNQTYDYVVFSIDGLKDTNHIYRKNVNWDKLIENATSYINAGGVAHWDMLVYKHNQHQVGDCEKLADNLGFSWFRAKVSKREYINGLEFPDNWENPQKELHSKIECMAIEEQSVYMDARGNIYPCCWLGEDLVHIPNLDQVSKTWNTKSCHPICKKNCTSVNNTNIFKSQWQKEIQLR